MHSLPLPLRPRKDCRWDLVSLGEVMLRLDPGNGRISTSRTFQAWEGGGEYNVARSLKRCFGLRTALVTAFADNPIGHLVEDLIYQGGVDQTYVRWVPYDGIGRDVRNGLYFIERGYGIRRAVGCSDRGHTAVSQLKPGQVDWDKIFGEDGCRWFHTGGIFAGLSETAQVVTLEAMKAARAHGTIVSYDLNYRPSLWRSAGGRAGAHAMDRALEPYVDVLLGIGFESMDHGPSTIDLPTFQKKIEQEVAHYPNMAVVATTLRTATTASHNDWGAVCYADGRLFRAPVRKDLEIFDRVGAGDSFGAGLIYGLLAGKGPQWAVDCGSALGALAMTTPGDTPMATLAEVEQVMQIGTAEVAR